MTKILLSLLIVFILLLYFTLDLSLKDRKKIILSTLWYCFLCVSVRKIALYLDY